MEFRLGDALKSLRPDEKWSIIGDEIHWSADNATTQPTEAELNAELERLKKFSPKKRIPYYPSIGDQLDMLWHAIEDGNWTAAKLKNTDFYTKLKAVKDDNPKP